MLFVLLKQGHDTQPDQAVNDVADCTDGCPCGPSADLKKLKALPCDFNRMLMQSLQCTADSLGSKHKTKVRIAWDTPRKQYLHSLRDLTTERVDFKRPVPHAAAQFGAAEGAGFDGVVDASLRHSGHVQNVQTQSLNVFLKIHKSDNFPSE